jgi:hypothetical protein
MIENLMIHGLLPRSTPSRRQRQPRSSRNVRHPQVRPQPLPQPERQAWHEWEEWVRADKERQTRRDTAGKPYCPPFRTRIEDDTIILPRLIARFVCEEASLWLGEPFPLEWQAELAVHANVVYQHHARFRQNIQKAGNAGRDWLIAYMRHWLCGLLASRRPDLCERLPGSYANGQDLPPHTTQPPGLRSWMASPNH